MATESCEMDLSGANLNVKRTSSREYPSCISFNVTLRHLKEIGEHLQLRYRIVHGSNHAQDYCLETRF